MRTHIQDLILRVVNHLQQVDDVRVVELLHNGDLSHQLRSGRVGAAAKSMLLVQLAAVNNFHSLQCSGR